MSPDWRCTQCGSVNEARNRRFVSFTEEVFCDGCDTETVQNITKEHKYSKGTGYR